MREQEQQVWQTIVGLTCKAAPSGVKLAASVNWFTIQSIRQHVPFKMSFLQQCISTWMRQGYIVQHAQARCLFALQLQSLMRSPWEAEHIREQESSIINLEVQNERLEQQLVAVAAREMNEYKNHSLSSSSTPEPHTVPASDATPQHSSALPIQQPTSTTSSHSTCRIRQTASVVL